MEGTERQGEGPRDSLLIARMTALTGLIRRHYYTYASEVELHEQLALVIGRAGIPVRREARLTPRDRVDLLVGDIAIEVKVKGKRVPLEQLERYAEHDAVGGLLLVTTRAATLPPTIGGKPAAVVSLLTNGLA